MAAVAASYVAVAAIYGSAVAVDAVKANDTAWATLTGATSAVMGKAVAILAGLNPDDYADMTAVAASSTAMAAVAASTAAVSAIEASSTAIAALVASPLATTASYAFSNSWTTRRSGKVFMISMKQTNFSGTSYSLYARYTINGNSQISCYFADANTTNGYSVKRFMDSITNYTNYSSSGTATYVFIPC